MKNTGSASGTNTFNQGFVAVPVSAAPEPGVWALMISGLAMIGGALRLQRRRTDGAATA